MLLARSAFRYATAGEAPMFSISENRFQKIPPTTQLSAAQTSFSPLEIKVLEEKNKMTRSEAVKGSFITAGGLCILQPSIGSHTHKRL
jgi:hypothetical protein